MYLKNNDCLNAMREMDAESVDVIYLDPPFFTQKKHKLMSKDGEVYSFSDKWASLEEYLEYVEIRLIEMKRILKKSGSLFLHCDKKVSHYLRGKLDVVFGEDNFRNEIIWKYRRWSNSKRTLLDSHQTIFFYSKGEEYKFNTKYTDYSPTTNVDQILQNRTRNSDGKTVYMKDSDGNIVYSKEKKGVPLSDVWEIPYLNPKAKERVGYPTQKPILLLERIIEISSDEGDVILDPFCGSGTTLVAAKLMNRKYIGFDINPSAIALTQQRLKNPIKSNSELLFKGLKSYQTKSNSELKILNSFDCNVVQRNKGLDGILRKEINGSKVGLKIQKEEETLTDSLNLLLKAMKKKSFLFAVLVRTHDTNSFFDFKIPDNIILIDSNEYLLNKFENKMEEKDNNFIRHSNWKHIDEHGIESEIL